MVLGGVVWVSLFGGFGTVDLDELFILVKMFFLGAFRLRYIYSLMVGFGLGAQTAGREDFFLGINKYFNGL